jgi:hypothetical protein
VSDRSIAPGGLGYEAFGSACGLAVVSGALAVVVPGFDILTATLVALALAGWASIHRRERRTATPLGPSLRRFAAPFAVLAVGVGVYVEPPAPVAVWRALLLGLGVVPLWLIERSGPGGRRGGGTAR